MSLSFCIKDIIPNFKRNRMVPFSEALLLIDRMIILDFPREASCSPPRNILKIHICYSKSSMDFYRDSVAPVNPYKPPLNAQNGRSFPWITYILIFTIRPGFLWAFAITTLLKYLRHMLTTDPHTISNTIDQVTASNKMKLVNCEMICKKKKNLSVCLSVRLSLLP